MESSLLQNYKHLFIKRNKLKLQYDFLKKLLGLINNKRQVYILHKIFVSNDTKQYLSINIKQYKKKKIFFHSITNIASYP